MLTFWAALMLGGWKWEGADGQSEEQAGRASVGAADGKSEDWHHYSQGLHKLLCFTEAMLRYFPKCF